MDAPRLTAITDFSNMNAGGQYLRQVVTSPSRFTIDSENADVFSPAVPSRESRIGHKRPHSDVQAGNQAPINGHSLSATLPHQTFVCGNR